MIRLLVVILVLASVHVALGQTRIVEENVLLPRLADRLTGNNVTIDGDTALVGWAEVSAQGTQTPRVTVFNRDVLTNWIEAATLSASGTRFAISGDTAVVVADRAAHVFQRDRGGPEAWRSVAAVVCDDPAGTALPSDVAISGNTLVVGVSRLLDETTLPFPTPLPGIACVFERNGGGSNAWRRVLTLRRETQPGMIDNFGQSVAISGNTIAVGSCDLRPAGLFSQCRETGFVFDRDHGGVNAWGLVKQLLPTTGVQNYEAFSPLIALYGDAAVLGVSRFLRSGPCICFDTEAFVFERNTAGGANNWGEVAHLVPVPPPVFQTQSVGINGNIIAVGSRVSDALPGTVYVYSRNQGGPGRWGRIAVVAASHGTFAHGQAVGVGATSIVTGDPLGDYDGSGTNTGAAYVFAIDTDGDGLRDGLDSCPRDPFNDKRCHRDAVASPAVDYLLSLNDVQTRTDGRDVVVTETLTNTSDQAIRNPFIQVTFAGNAFVLNADGGRKEKSGATISPDVGDGLLSPGEQMTFAVELRENGQPISEIRTNVHGDVEP